MIVVEKGSTDNCNCSGTPDLPPTKKKLTCSELDHLLGEDVDKEENNTAVYQKRLPFSFKCAMSTVVKIHLLGGKAPAITSLILLL